MENDAQKSPGSDALAFAGQLGRQQGEAFDRSLREAEARDREERLARAAWRPRMSREAWAEEADSLKVVQLEARLSELNTYLRAIDESLPWRLIQALRRMVGRAW